MPNPYVNKVQLADGTSLIDLTMDTAIASDVAQGKYFHLSTGERVQGTASGAAAISVVDELDSHGGTIRHINGVSLQGDTVTAAHLEYGYTAHDAGGNAITGELVPGGSPNLQAKTNISPTTSSQTITADTGYDGLSSVQINAMPTGTARVPSSITGTSANMSAGTNQLTFSKDISLTPDVTAGYIASGTARTASVSLTANVTTKSGTTYHPSTSDQSVAAITFCTGAQTFKGVTHNLTADIIKSGEVVKIGDSTDDDCVASITGTYEGSGGGGSTSVTVATKTTTLSSASSSISFTGLSGNPTSFVVTSSVDQSTGGTRAVAVAYDGTSLHGMDITTQAEADTGFSKSYSSGTLTITATSATFGANEYKLVYTYGGASSDIHTEDVQVGSGATSITFTGLSGRPIYFSCVFKSSFGTSSGYQRVIDVVNDGTNTYGHEMDSSAKYSAAHWSYTYSGSSLTITSQGTNAGGYFHQPGYYQLTYAVDDSAPSYQVKTGIGASTSSQTITADSGYDALESVQINAVTQTNLTAANIKSGTTVTISNGSTNLWSVTGTYSGGGGSLSVDTKTVTASNYPVSISFTSMKGQPQYFFLRSTSQISSSGSTTYYYIIDLRYDGNTNKYCDGNCFRIGSTRRVDPITTSSSGGTVTGYTWSYSGTTLTIPSSAASRSASPGSFNNTYELVYLY